MNRGTIELYTERLVLRRFEEADAMDVYRLWGSREEVYKTLLWKPHRSQEETRKILQQWKEKYSTPNRYYWCIDYKDGQKCIGSVYLVNYNEMEKSLEAGFCLSPEYWNKGIITEALIGAVDYIASLEDMKYVWGRHHIENPASGRVFQKAGFIFDRCEILYSPSVQKEIETLIYVKDLS